VKTLSEYEAEGAERLKTEREIVMRGFKLIGIACDKCGHELAGERSLLCSSPPQQNIYCPNCLWEGRRTVY
jgi:late competence protein required for DNA uptake (superfamily II DNA/RNA helicase)